MLIRKKLQQREGITLLELLIVIGLTGLIFSLGIYPMLSQLKLLNAQRAEISLFDEANLAVFYITRDAMRAERADTSVIYEITFTITTDSTTSPRTTKTVRYYTDPSNRAILRRSDSVTGEIVITRLLNPDPGMWPVFQLDTPRLHRLASIINFRDSHNYELTTRRRFGVMLRCRDAYK